MEWLGQYRHSSRFAGEPVPLELACVLADPGHLAGLSLSRSVRGQRAATGAPGKELLRGSLERASDAIGSAFSFQRAEHDLLSVGTRSEAGARNDRASGRPSSPVAGIQRPAGGPADARSL